MPQRKTPLAGWLAGSWSAMFAGRRRAEGSGAAAGQEPVDDQRQQGPGRKPERRPLRQAQQRPDRERGVPVTMARECSRPRFPRRAHAARHPPAQYPHEPAGENRRPAPITARPRQQDHDRREHEEAGGEPPVGCLDGGDVGGALAGTRRFADLGGTVLPGSPDDFAKLVRDETEKWAKVIRAANIKVE